MGDALLTAAVPRRLPEAGAVLELLKPLTWFPPCFAFGCGIVSSGVPLADRCCGACNHDRPPVLTVDVGKAALPRHPCVLRYPDDSLCCAA